MSSSIKGLLNRARAARFTNPRESFELTGKILARTPKHAPALKLRGQLSIANGDIHGGRDLLLRAADIDGKDAELLLDCARAHYHLGDIEAAISAAESAVKIDASLPGAMAQWLGMRLQRGEFDKGLPELEKAVKKYPNDVGLAMTYAEFAERMNKLPEAINLLEEHLANNAIDDHDRALAEHRLADLLDRRGEYDRAFELARQANERRKTQWNSAAYDQFVRRLTTVWKAKYFQQNPPADNDSDTAVLIVGMPRSGTSLVEQILASHPQVAGVGELNKLPELVSRLAAGAPQQGPASSTSCLSRKTADELGDEYLAYLRELAPEAKRITDKLPLNFQNLFLVQQALPRSRVIHCIRDARDTCLSCYFTDFGAGHAFANDLTHLGNFYRTYRRLMQHWHDSLSLPMLEVHYEELVTDLELQARQMVSFLDLEWDDRCLQFFESKRAVYTASNEQVRRPIYESSVGRHRNYADHLAPLYAILDS